MLQVYLDRVREEIEYLLAYIDDVDEFEVLLGSNFVSNLRKVSADCSDLISELDFK